MYKVYLSRLAQTQIDMLLDYLEIEWSKVVREKFMKTTLKSFRRIEKFPESWSRSEEFPELHQCILTKQTSYFYRIRDSKNWDYLHKKIIDKI